MALCILQIQVNIMTVKKFKVTFWVLSNRDQWVWEMNQHVVTKTARVLSSVVHAIISITRAKGARYTTLQQRWWKAQRFQWSFARGSIMGDGQKQEQCILIIMVILGTVCYFHLLFNMQECFQLSIPLLCWIGCSMLYNTMSALSACTTLCQPVDSFPVFCTK